MSTLPPVSAKISPLNSDTLFAIPSVLSPASSASVFAARRNMEMVFIVVPTLSASCTTLFAAVTRAILSSSVLLPAANAEAERSKASPTPLEEIAKLLPTSLNLSTINIAPSASMPKARIVEMMLSDAVPTSSMPSPTFLYTNAASASIAASSRLYPSLAKSADALTVSEIVAPNSRAREVAFSRKLI